MRKWILALIIPCFFFGENITVIGIGRLGLCIALSLEQAGYHVLGVDLSPDYIAKLNEKTFRSPEPFVNDYLEKSRHFRATTSLVEGLAFSDLILIAVTTTVGVDSYDFRYLTQLVADINSHRVANKEIVICSTLFPGHIQNHVLPALKDCTDVTVSYNPPFIAQGEIIKIFRFPDIVLIGEGSREVGDRLEKIYQKVCPNAPQIERMSVASAEIAKLALNCFVTAKIAYANLVADIADETPGADKWAILKAVGKDSRIGSKCLRPGYGFGGPCFPRDNRGLGRYAELKGIEPVIFYATDRANDQHADYMARKFIEQDLSEYVFEDVSYKPNSPVAIIEASQKLAVAQKVAAAGKKVTLIDKKAVLDQVIAQYGDLFKYKEQSCQN
ncbi:MAG TPA: nucleotide sugar dehydrogenase [Chlamydiales bacterium]|nr:nucleotide sugar dehydrogenase [Chlamydiales bacterium]